MAFLFHLSLPELISVFNGWQKVSELINHSDELLQRRIAADAERVLKHINEALMMSSYSEKLLEMKAEALFMVRISVL